MESSLPPSHSESESVRRRGRIEESASLRHSYIPLLSNRPSSSSSSSSSSCSPFSFSDCCALPSALSLSLCTSTTLGLSSPSPQACRCCLSFPPSFLQKCIIPHVSARERKFVALLPPREGEEEEEEASYPAVLHIRVTSPFYLGRDSIRTVAITHSTSTCTESVSLPAVLHLALSKKKKRKFFLHVDAATPVRSLKILAA